MTSRAFSASFRPLHTLGLLMGLAALTLCPPDLQASMSPDQTTNNRSSGCLLELRPELPESIPGTAGFSFRLPGEGMLGMAGCPDLPLMTRLVEIPARSGVRLVIDEEVWTSLGSAAVEPLQERLHTEADLPLAWIQDATVYGSQDFWPAQPFALSDPMLLRDTRLVELQVAPLRWNPATGELLHLESLRCHLVYEGENPVNALDHEPRPSALFGPLIARSVIGLQRDGELADVTFESAALPLNYLVVTRTSSLSNDRFQDWIDWKYRKGHHITVVTENNVNWNTTGIRNRIISEYAGEFPPDYVMLVGDADGGGTMMLPTSNSQYDHFYAMISGNDVLADVVVGRISARNTTTLTTIFNKILAYELTPDLSNPDWLHRASFLTGEGHCGLSMKQLSRSIAFELVDDYGYTQIDTAWCAQSPSYVPNWYTQGISFHNYRGWVGMEGLDRNALLNMTQGNRTPISVIFTCNSGTFNDPFYEPAFTETFLRAGTATTPGGGAAAMGFCTPNTHTAYNNIVCGGFWSGVLDYRIRQVGTAMFLGKYELYRSLPNGDVNISNFSYWANLMGDPGMNVWVGEPDVLSIDGLPASLPTGSTRFEVHVVDQQGNPVNRAAVCLSQPDLFQDVALTDAAGLAVFTLPEDLDDAYHLRVTATHDDCVPALAEVNVTQAALPMVDTPIWNDTQNWAIPGEPYELLLTVHNLHDVAISGATLSLQLDPAQGVASVDQASIPDLEPGESAQISAPFVLTLDPGLTDSPDISLDLLLEAGPLTVLHRVNTTLRAPRIEVTDPNADDVILEPDGTTNLTVTLHNSGELAAAPLSFSAEVQGSNLIQLTAQPSSFDLNAGQSSSDLVFPLAMDPAAWPGTRAILAVDWSDQGGRHGSFRVPLAVGAGTVSEPCGPDEFGYLAWENSDSWSEAPVFDWVEIAPAAGGSGTLLNLSDHGDEQDDAVLLDLPFPIRFYGIEYDQMGVCSNGFVSFGPNAHLETDFRNHFLPIGMGPDPMMAVMWDDHYLGAGSEVCWWHDEENARVVVEWYNVLTNSNGSHNTFQLILPDPAVTPGPSGEGEFTFQYLNFENNQSNDQDFSYCTIGIKDETALRGLTVTNYDTWSPNATEFTGNRAIRFTVPLSIPVGDGAFGPVTEGLYFQLGDEEIDSAADTLYFENIGEGLLPWSAHVELDHVWPLDGSRSSGGDDHGYSWVDSDSPDGPVFQWVDALADGTAVDFSGNDTAFGPVALPFAFPYYGSLRDSLYISPNGWISFGDSGSWWQNSGGLPTTDGPFDAIAVWWDDLMQNDDLNGHCAWRATDDSLIVAWIATPHFNPESYGGPFTFQAILESNGRITLQYDEMTASDSDSDSGTIGLSGPDISTGFVIRHMQLARDQYAVRITPPAWLSVQNSSGSTLPGAIAQVVVRAINAPNALLMPAGDYTARVILSSAGIEGLEIPVGLSVGTTGLQDEPALPETITLGQPVPNPFNPTTRISLELASPTRISLGIFNIRGQLVSKLVESQTVAAGSWSWTMDGSGLASGVYLLRLDSPSGSQVRKLMLIK